MVGGPYHNYYCVVILSHQDFVPFDDAKVRRFPEKTMTFLLLCAITARIFDQNQ